MTIIYNKNAPGQYIVTGLDDRDDHQSISGYNTRRTIGDYTVISSTRKMNSKTSAYDRIAKVMKKFLFVLAVIPIVPFATSPALGYINHLVKMK